MFDKDCAQKLCTFKTIIMKLPILEQGLTIIIICVLFNNAKNICLQLEMSKFVNDKFISISILSLVINLQLLTFNIVIGCFVRYSIQDHDS